MNASTIASIDTASIAPLKRARKPNGISDFFKRLIRTKKVGAVGGLLFMIIFLAGVFAPWLAPYGMNEIAPIDRLKSPSFAHWFGTDNLGRDVLSRCLYGAQISMIIAFATAGLSTVISVAVGMISGYLGGRADMFIQRVVDAINIFPGLIILIMVASIFGPGMVQIILALGILLGVGGSRIIRGAVIGVRENMYVTASQSIGASTWRILRTHILPNILPPVIVLFTTRIGSIILTESSLSFLGLGVPPPAPSWGGMLSGSGRTYMHQGPWLALAPGLCLAIVVYSINMFGDALRDLLDPRMRGSR